MSSGIPTQAEPLSTAGSISGLNPRVGTWGGGGLLILDMVEQCGWNCYDPPHSYILQI